MSEKSQKWSNNGRASKCRKFSVGDTLFARNYRGKTVWIPATVIPTGVEVSQLSDTEDWPLPQTCLTAPMVGNTDTSGNISESVSIDVPTRPIR